MKPDRPRIRRKHMQGDFRNLQSLKQPVRQGQLCVEDEARMPSGFTADQGIELSLLDRDPADPEVTDWLLIVRQDSEEQPVTRWNDAPFRATRVFCSQSPQTEFRKYLMNMRRHFVSCPASCALPTGQRRRTPANRSPDPTPSSLESASVLFRRFPEFPELGSQMIRILHMSSRFMDRCGNTGNHLHDPASEQDSGRRAG